MIRIAVLMLLYSSVCMTTQENIQCRKIDATLHGSCYETCQEAGVRRNNHQDDNYDNRATRKWDFASLTSSRKDLYCKALYIFDVEVEAESWLL